MPRPIIWIENNAGFVASNYRHSNGHKVTKPNTQVAALAIFESAVTGIPVTYDTMYHMLTKDLQQWVDQPGRRSRKREFFYYYPTWTLHRYRMPMEFLRPWIEKQYKVTWVPTTWIGAKEQLHLDSGVFYGDRVALARLSSDEVVPVLEGVAIYPWDPNGTLAEGKSRMVYGYWTMS